MSNYGLGLAFGWAEKALDTVAQALAKLGYPDQARKVRQMRDELIDIGVEVNG